MGLQEMMLLVTINVLEHQCEQDHCPKGKFCLREDGDNKDISFYHILNLWFS